MLSGLGARHAQLALSYKSRAKRRPVQHPGPTHIQPQGGGSNALDPSGGVEGKQATQGEQGPDPRHQPQDWVFLHGVGRLRGGGLDMMPRI